MSIYGFEFEINNFIRLGINKYNIYYSLILSSKNLDRKSFLLNWF